MKRLKKLIHRLKKTPQETAQRNDADGYHAAATAFSSNGVQSLNESSFEQTAVDESSMYREEETGLPLGAEPYQYHALKQPRNFRVLHLQRRQSEHETYYRELTLQGTIIEASLDSPNIPEYFALSYTWGQPDLVENIYVDNRPLKITANCAAALRRMLRQRMERNIWVDAICINQSKDTEAVLERNRQVGMMDWIYMKAVQVNVYLGPGDEASDLACSALNSLREAYVLAKIPGPQQEEGRIKYEKLADDVLSEKLYTCDRSID
jgi:hypothetical protein